ncbi:MAG: hypothetical protein K9K81_10570 [Desulfobacteraceae bacterium]|nr:hypothetical protein [Desulfobacteraceae bacterium]
MLLVKRLIFLILIAAFIAGPLSATATAASGDYKLDSRPDGASMAADFFFIRPLALASTVFGSATFVVSLPFSALGKNVGPSFELLVIAPGRYTFDRPLGDFD